MNLTASDICLIINSCRMAQVASIEIAGENIKIAFEAKPIVEKSSPVQSTIETEQGQEITIPITFSEFETKPEVESEKDVIEELQISDPVRFEDMLGRGEIVDAGTESN